MLSVTRREVHIENEYICAACEIVGRTPHADTFRSIIERLRASEFTGALNPKGMTGEYAALKLRTDLCWIIISRHHNFRYNREIHFSGMPIPQSALFPEKALLDDLRRLGVDTKFPDTFKLIGDFLKTDFRNLGANTASPLPPEGPSLLRKSLLRDPGVAG